MIRDIREVAAICGLAFLLAASGIVLPARADEPVIETIGDVKSPMGVFMDGRGFLYSPDGYNHVIWWGTSTIKFSMYIGALAYNSTWGDPSLWGDPIGGYGGDGIEALGPGKVVYFKRPTAVFIDRGSSIYIADSGNNVVRRIDGTGVLSTVAGSKLAVSGAVGGFTGAAGFSGDNGPATSATFEGTTGVFVDGSGIVYIADQRNHRVRMVDKTGTVKTIAGNGTPAFSGDGGAATSASLNFPFSVFTFRIR